MADTLLAARAAEQKIQKLYGELQGASSSGADQAAKDADGLHKTLLKGGAQAPADAVNAARQEIEAITARSQRLLDQAQGRAGTDASVFVEKMTAQASQDLGGRASDLTGFMAQTGGGGGTRVRGLLPGDPQGPLSAPAPAVSTQVVANAVPGRRITGSGARQAGWMFIDSWYVVGPFPNKGRQNIRTRFGPEDLVDLDQTFRGAGGRTLKWRFWQTNTPRVVPPDAQEYAVYYLATELYSDRPRDLWLAIGSDDQSNLWINEQLVWMSSDQLKGWQAGEGLRRVRLQQGRNRILLRLENGWRGVDTSLIFSLAK